LSGDCDQTLTNPENKLASTDFENQLITTLVDVMARGRAEGRADPPEGFQIYTAGYVQFWNHDDEGCDHISWAWWGQNVPILRGLRFRMNVLVDKLNNVILPQEADRLSNLVLA
jgi:hypothetical protein